MDSATTTAVPAIALPEGTDVQWVAIWITAPDDQYDAVAERLVTEKGAGFRRRFNSQTGEEVPNPELVWIEDDIPGVPGNVHFELRKASKS